MFEVQNKFQSDAELWNVSWKNNRIVTGSINGKISVFDTDIVLLKQFEASALGIVSIATDGIDVVCSTMDGKLKYWNIERGELKLDRHFGCGNIWHIRWQPNSSIIAFSNSEGGISRFDLVTQESLPVLQGASSFITALAYSQDGKYLASGNKEGGITIFETASGTQVNQFDAHSCPIRCVAFSYSNTLLTGADDQMINIFDIFSKSKLGTLYGHSSWIFSISCSSNQTHVASCSADKTVRVWSLADNTCLTTLHHHTEQVLGIEWSAFGDYLVSVSEDKSIISYKCLSK
jgi:WD repeat-containing protein 61